MISNASTTYSYLLLARGRAPTDTDFDFISRIKGATNQVNLQGPEFVVTNYGLRVLTPAASAAHAFTVLMTTNRTDLRQPAYPVLKPHAFTTTGTITNAPSQGAYHYFQVDVPTNLPGWRVVLSTTNANADLYVQRGARPTAGSYLKYSSGQPIDTIVLDNNEATNATVRGTLPAGVYTGVKFVLGLPFALKTVSITSPASGSSFTQGTSIGFAGTASDAEDGNLSSSLAWASSLNGAIGSGASFATSALSVGTHTVTASVTDSGGASGSASITVTVNASGSTPPAAPSNLTAQSVTSGSGRNKTLVAVNLSWIDNSNSEEGFVIERTTETGSRRNKQCGAFAEIGTVGANTTASRDSTVSSRTTYCYQVKAISFSFSMILAIIRAIMSLPPRPRHEPLTPPACSETSEPGIHPEEIKPKSKSKQRTKFSSSI